MQQISSAQRLVGVGLFSTRTGQRSKIRPASHTSIWGANADGSAGRPNAVPLVDGWRMHACGRRKNSLCTFPQNSIRSLTRSISYRWTSLLGCLEQFVLVVRERHAFNATWLSPRPFMNDFRKRFCHHHVCDWRSRQRGNSECRCESLAGYCFPMMVVLVAHHDAIQTVLHDIHDVLREISTSTDGSIFLH
jgi:hypothetical protein